MKTIKIGDLKDLMPYINEIKFSFDGVMFRGVYYNPALAENTPFCVRKTLSVLDPKEYEQLMDIELPNGHKVYEVFAKIREYTNGGTRVLNLPSEERMKWLNCHEVHFACKHYGGTCNYCHKRHEIIKNPCRCGFFEEKENLRRRGKNA